MNHKMKDAITKVIDALEWYADLPKEWKIITKDGLTYGDLRLLGERAREALVAFKEAQAATPGAANNVALAEMIRQSIRFSSWAAGEGICPIAGEPASAPDDFMMAYSVATGDEQWETLADRVATRILSVLEASPADTRGEAQTLVSRLLLIDERTAVKVGGSRFDGWLFRKHPDGQWISVRKLEEGSKA